MSDKKENIIQTALHLFSKHGYTNTSTAKVAKDAGVSEGLIFRHFENKAGLLQAILDLGKEQADALYATLFSLDCPKTLIKKALELPFMISEEQRVFWKLIYSLKWQTDSYDSSMSDPLRAVLIGAFEELNYPDPASEAELVLVVIDGLATSLLLRKPNRQNELLLALLAKYGL